MGISVNEEMNCYDGVSWQAKEGKAKRTTKSAKEKSQKAKNKRKYSSRINTWFDNVMKYSTDLYERYPVPFIITYVTVLIGALISSTMFVIRLVGFKTPPPTRMDDDLKEKRRKILEKRAKKVEEKHK